MDRRVASTSRLMRLAGAVVLATASFAEGASSKSLARIACVQANTTSWRVRHTTLLTHSRLAGTEGTLLHGSRRVNASAARSLQTCSRQPITTLSGMSGTSTGGATASISALFNPLNSACPSSNAVNQLSGSTQVRARAWPTAIERCGRDVPILHLPPPLPSCCRSRSTRLTSVPRFLPGTPSTSTTARRPSAQTA